MPGRDTLQTRVRARGCWQVAIAVAMLGVAAGVRAAEYPKTPPRTYEGPYLEAVAMPIGGIGTGTVWLDGQSRLAVWQIANNQDESRVPDSFLALSAKSPGGEPLLRVLQTTPERGLPAFQKLSFEGGYPIAGIEFADPALPLRVRLDAYNPMVPLDVDASSLPAALFRVTLTNTSAAPVEAVLAATLRNAYGNRNRLAGNAGLAAVVLEQSEDPVRSGPVVIRSAAGETVPGPGILWLEQAPGLTGPVVGAMRRVLDEGGILVVGNVQPAFFDDLRRQAALRAQGTPAVTVFEDFEKDSYEGWTVTGEAFGRRPTRGTLGGQQEVSGFVGSGLVNTFIDGDRPQGTATSKPFTIEHAYIGMLVGGGAHRNPAMALADSTTVTLFEDFEQETYEGWTVTGEAFGVGPATGTLANQQQVSGFAGQRLVNTYLGGNDGLQGTAISRPFQIEKPFIAFLLGGGNRPGEVGVDLCLDGQVVRTATGLQTEALSWISWDVSDLHGKEATIQIVDRSSEAWGHANVDQIVFSATPIGEACVNLLVNGRVVRSASGHNVEALAPAVWDVSDLRGQEAVIEIVDRVSGGWGHINVDQIVFSDTSPEAVLTLGTDLDRVVTALGNVSTAAERVTAEDVAPGGAVPHLVLTPEAPPALRSVALAWRPEEWTRLGGMPFGGGGLAVLAKGALGDPLLLQGPLGKGHLVLALAPGLPWSWGTALIMALRGAEAMPGEAPTPGHEGWGEICLSALDPAALALERWSTEEELHAFLRDPHGATRAAPAAASVGPLNAAVGLPLRLAPGEVQTRTIALTWRFPNVQRFGHRGNDYCRRWPSALAVAQHLAARHEDLWAATRLYHDSVYQSNLPEEFLDAMTSQSIILRGPTCFRSEEGYFGGFEGCYGCCPLNCTHVWNYAQTHARLFPELARNMRVSDFVTYLHEDGETSHRQHGPHSAFIDGHCACIEGAYREHLMSPDRGFLESIWPGVRKAVDWMVGRFDADGDGVPSGQQWNTYDCAVSGENTFIGSQYLCALAAGEQMALAMGDAESAARWRPVREAGMRNQNERLWNGSYYIQKPGTPPAHDYNHGCHSDQLLGQWWAHQLDLGYLYPPDRVRAALAAVVKHNVRTSFAGFTQAPRRYVPDDEGGLLMCTWPGNDRPNPFIIYADEVWTGIEYSTAGTLVYEGMIEPARQIVQTARSRYDGRLRPGLDSGPGGNPFNELECGKFYARAMSSWGLLSACQGQVVDGPRGVLGFRPRWQPADHRSFFTAPEGWGLFSQQREASRQAERIEVRHGRLRVQELVFELPAADLKPTVTLTVSGQPVPVTATVSGTVVRLATASPLVVTAGGEIRGDMRW
jgi:uncharacterized protein (DUF608 family)